MCLSTVYRGAKKPETEILKNVMLIECKDGVVTLTDIMGREEKDPRRGRLGRSDRRHA